MVKRKRRTHGHSRGHNGRPTRTYKTWQTMHQRCANPNKDGYENYGGRGIRVCARWSSFEAFVADMGERPPGKTLDRIHPNKHYTPANCRWATPKEQGRNRRTTKMTVVGAVCIRVLRDRGATLNALAAAFGVSRQLICDITKGRRWVEQC